jgi:hypothetical protein
MPVDEAIDFCKVMFSHIDNHAVTTDQCGFHVSVSDSSSRKMKRLQVDKMISEINQDYIYRHFSSRKKSEHCKLDSHGHDGAVNLEHLSSDNPYVEFRFLGGKNYHKKFKESKKVIFNYVDALQKAL